MRETTSLGRERAHQRCLFSPLPTVFSRALFSTLSPLFGETSACDGSQDFLRKTLFIPVLRSIVETYRARPCPKGDGKEGKWGTGGETPEGEGGLQQCCTPLPWGCLPKTAVERSCVTGTVSHKDRHPPQTTKTRRPCRERRIFLTADTPAAADCRSHPPAPHSWWRIRNAADKCRPRGPPGSCGCRPVPDPAAGL